MSATRRALAITAAVLGGGAVLASTSPTIECSQLANEIEAGHDHISAIEVGELIMRGNSQLRIFDLRSAREFNESHIPGAVQSTLSDLVRVDLPRDSPIVIYSAGGGHAAQAWTLLRLRNYQNVFFLREGVYEWMSRVEQPQLAVDATAAERADFERAKTLSRFFGGSVTIDVPRSEIRHGYWTNSPNDGMAPSTVSSADASATPRRRGC